MTGMLDMKPEVKGLDWFFFLVLRALFKPLCKPPTQPTPPDAAGAQEALDALGQALSLGSRARGALAAPELAHRLAQLLQGRLLAIPGAAPGLFDN